MKVVLAKRRQITLPKEFMEEMGLEFGDILNCHLENGRVIISGSDKSKVNYEYVNQPKTVFNVPSSGLAIFCFQRFNMFLDGQPLHITGRKPRELIALLATCGEPLTMRACASFLWPDSNSYQARDNLYKLIKRIKTTYSMISILHDSKTILLRSQGVYCDVFDFVRLCGKPDYESWLKALNLYRGLLLYEESYEWVSEFEVRYEILYKGLLNKMNIKY